MPSSPLLPGPSRSSFGGTGSTIPPRRGNGEAAFSPMPDVPLGQFRMWRPAEGMADPWGVHSLLDGTRPKMIRGYGGWGQTAREGRRAVSKFEGAETPAYSVGLRLAPDRPTEQNVGDVMRALERLAGVQRPLSRLRDDEPPPVVQWIGNVEHDYQRAPRTRWVIEDLEWGDSASVRGKMTYQDATLIIAVFVDTRIPDLGSMETFDQKKLTREMDLRDFAKRHLGDPKRWRDVADLNRDKAACPQGPHAKPKKAVMLLLPPREPRRGRR